MSRSYKKPWLKDPSNSYMKKIHARIMRRKVRQILTEYKKTMLPEWETFFWLGKDWDVYLRTPDGPEIPHYREVTNQYDVCDYCFWSSCPEDRRK